MFRLLSDVRLKKNLPNSFCQRVFSKMWILRKSGFLFRQCRIFAKVTGFSILSDFHEREGLMN
jgi:hypothetical protein